MLRRPLGLPATIRSRVEDSRLVDDVCPVTTVEVFGSIPRPNWAILPSLEPASFRQAWQLTVEVDRVNA